MTHVNYDNIETFTKVLDAVKHLGYEDTTYGNDTCPSISRDFETAIGNKCGLITLILKCVKILNGQCLML